MVWCLVLSHALLVGLGIFAFVFYYYPDRIVIGKWGFVLSTLLIPAFNYVTAHSERLLGLTDAYLGGIARHLGLTAILTLLVFTVLAGGAAYMWSSIVERYRYVDIINEALKGGLPTPESLGTAFQLMPQRPEVPFVLIRASRLLSFDDRPDNFYFYMDRFFSQVDKDAIVKRFKEFKRPNNVSIDKESPPLPVLDPIQQLVNFYVEKEKPTDALSWAIDTLKTYRGSPGDTELTLLRTLFEAELAYNTERDPVALRSFAQDAIRSIEHQIDPTQTRDAFRSLSFATDHVYQEALDTLSWLKADGLTSHLNTPPLCQDNEEIAANFQRILLLRRRMLTRTDLVWWRPPTKLSLHYLYLHFGGQKGKVSTLIYDAYNRCPGRIARLKELYDAAAFKAFQEPDYWNQGTPLSPAFQGSAAITQLRQWLRSGW